MSIASLENKNAGRTDDDRHVDQNGGRYHPRTQPPGGDGLCRDGVRPHDRLTSTAPARTMATADNLRTLGRPGHGRPCPGYGAGPGLLSAIYPRPPVGA